MNTIISGCNFVAKVTVDNYEYFLFTRIDNYAVIMRKDGEDEILYNVILDNEDVSAIWADVENREYKMPNNFDVNVKKYIVTKNNNYTSSRNFADKW
jgi:hypothetical protein